MNLESKIENMKINELPSEVSMKIIKDIKEINDLINIYDIFHNSRKIIIIEINKYLNIKDEKERIKYWIHDIICPIEIKIKSYFDDDEIEEKKESLKELKILYKKHEIYKIIIGFYLTCNNCKYKYNVNNDYVYKHFYECLNCGNVICSECCTDCDYCNFGDIILYHCLICKKDKCLKTIKKEINEIEEKIPSDVDSDDDNENFNYLRKLKLKYCKNILNLVYDQVMYLDEERKIDEVFDILNKDN